MSKQILLVEDDLLLSEMYFTALQDSGFEVTLFKDGRKAIQADPQNFDLVLLDIRLPEVDGLEILKFYRSHGYDKPIIVITNSPQVSQSQAKSLGASDFLVKSHVDIADVLRSVFAYF